LNLAVNPDAGLDEDGREQVVKPQARMPALARALRNTPIGDSVAGWRDLSCIKP
jgi:hypothetical protein